MVPSQKAVVRSAVWTLRMDTSSPDERQLGNGGEFRNQPLHEPYKTASTTCEPRPTVAVLLEFSKGVRAEGLEPSTQGLKVLCSTD